MKERKGEERKSWGLSMHKSFMEFIDCRVLDQYCEWENWEEEKEVLKSDCVGNEMNLL